MNLHAYHTAGRHDLLDCSSNVHRRTLCIKSLSTGSVAPVGVRDRQSMSLDTSHPPRSICRVQCLVFSLAHLSSFIGTARACVVHRAAASIGQGVAAAEGDAKDAMAAAWSAQSVARQASSEALSAITRATSAAASARNEGSVLLEEVMLASRVLYWATLCNFVLSLPRHHTHIALPFSLGRGNQPRGSLKNCETWRPSALP